MDLGTYLKWNFLVGGVMALLLVLGVFALKYPYVSGILVLVLAVVAYRQYRKVAYFGEYSN